MAFLTRPASVGRGVEAVLTIAPAELAAFAVIPDGYYKNTNNWKEVKLEYKHSDSNQRTVVSFSGQETGSFLVSSSSRLGVWGLESILIKDYDGGEVFINKASIPSVSDYSILVTIPATHGDLYVPNGQLIQVPANGKRQYGSLIIESGGTLEVANGAGILEIEVLGTCRIDGMLKANRGKHTGGTWSSVSVLGESISHTITQGNGGNGGSGEALVENAIKDYTNNSFTKTIGDAQLEQANGVLKLSCFSGGTDVSPGQYGTYSQYEASFPTIVGQRYTVSLKLVGISNIVRTYAEWQSVGLNVRATPSSNTDQGLNLTSFSDTDAINTVRSFSFTATETASKLVLGHTYGTGVFEVSNITVEGPFSTLGGQPGLGNSGNGGGGGRAAIFGALDGSAASQLAAGLGAGQDDPATVDYNTPGAHSATESEAGSGGFRGRHGQCVYLKAERIDGSGIINAAGMKGGDGGNGAEYLNNGILYANGAGGGGAGGSGGAVWLRYSKGTPTLTVNVAGGERGSAGANMPDAGQATHGDMGAVGFVDIKAY